ncbi:MAG TPA: hypothetical protein VK982_04230 [Bacteroidales bacterium]|nr:hypothetical protein [Bacteroidales bacterium]
MMGCDNSDSLKLDGVRDDFAKDMNKIYNELEEASKTDNPSEIINDEYDNNYSVNIFPKYFDSGNDKEQCILAEIGMMIIYLKDNEINNYIESKNFLFEVLQIIDDEE